MKFILILSLLLLGSCSSYIQSIHSQIDKEEGAKRAAYKRRQNYYDPYNAYRGIPMRGQDRRPIKNPVTLGGGRNMRPSTQTQRNYPPEVARQYGANKGRTSADDLKDNDASGSLWSGKTGESFLFVTNNVKKEGDIVIVEVLGKLKSEISNELKRVFPKKKAPVLKKSLAAKTAEGQKEPAKAPEPPAAEKKPENTKQIYDKISTLVVEQINRDYLLVRGRKEVLFRKVKRYVEVQGLVSRKDITDNDTVASDKLLEPKITVLRY